MRFLNIKQVEPPKPKAPHSRPCPPSDLGLAALYSLPEFWRGALATRRSIIKAADDAASPNAEAMHRSDLIIANLKGEEPQFQGRPEPLSDADRTWHEEAIARLETILSAAEAGNRLITALPEFERWHSPSGFTRSNPRGETPMEDLGLGGLTK